MNAHVAHGGGTPEGYDVPPTGIKIADPNTLRRFFAGINASDEPMYVALTNSVDGVTCPAEVGKGLYLPVYGGGFELNNVNMYFDEIWVIHGGTGTKRLCVQTGQ